MPDAIPLLAMRGISKRFGATLALDGADLRVRAGEVHALVGENGSGKSTLMGILAGAIRPDAGAMEFDGAPFAPRSPMDARRRGVAMIHQELALAGHLSVAENILLGMEESRLGVLNGAAMRARAAAALTVLGHGDLDPEARVNALPLAVRQVVEIARAVAVGSRIVVLDEPTSSLAQADTEQLFQVVRRLAEDGHAVIYITHFLEEVERISDRITVLRDGRVVGTSETAGVSRDEMVSMMVGRRIDTLYPRSARTPGDVILEVDGLTGASRPLGASFTLRRGEALGVFGLNGSGRTEILRAVFGLDPVRSGAVRLGVHTGPAAPAQRWEQGAGLLSEDRKQEGLALTMSVADNITLTALGRMGPAGLVSPERQARAAGEWIRRLGIRCAGTSQPVRALSGGNQQKVALARLMHHDVDVLLLDEPTKGVDVGSKETIYRLMDEAALAGKAVLMVSSYLPELLGVCDRVAVMRRGRLGDAVAAENTDPEAIMREAAGA